MGAGGADAFHAEEQSGEGGTVAVANVVEDLQTLSGSGGTLLARMHQTGAGPFHQGHRLQGACPRNRRAARQGEDLAQCRPPLQVASHVPVQAE